MSNRGWIGVDLDGTLAHYDGWKGPEHIGEPIMPMVERIWDWLAAGQEVRIFTARVYRDGTPRCDLEVIHTRKAIERWMQQHLQCVLPITNEKDFGMICLYDDRCVQVVPNTGELVERQP